MKTEKINKITLYFCLFLTILFEVVVAVLVYGKIGDERITISIFRLIVQLIFFIIIIFSNSRVAVFILTLYHVILGLYFFMKDIEFMYILFGMYHFFVGIGIYFNDVIDLKLKNKL